MATVINGDTAGVHTSAAVECLQLITTNYTISSGYNAGFFGPVPTNNPYLGNQADFIAYRNVIRAIAVYPPAGDIVWATPPVEVWK